MYFFFNLSFSTNVSPGREIYQNISSNISDKRSKSIAVVSLPSSPTFIFASNFNSSFRASIKSIFSFIKSSKNSYSSKLKFFLAVIIKLLPVLNG